MLFAGALAALWSPVRALSLTEARRMAHDNYPAICQYQLIAQSRDYTLANVAKAWLPQVSVSAGAYGFTDVLKESPLTRQAGIDVKNYLANGTVSLTQSVYDGGKTAAQRRVAAAQSEVQARELDVSVYAVNERVDQLFFGLLLLNEQLKQNELLQNDLSTSEQTVRSMMQGGVAHQVDLDVVLVEQLRARQQREALAAMQTSYRRMLSVFVGTDLAADEPLEKPANAASSATWGERRPEISFYNSQNALLTAQRKQLDARLRPTVSLFGAGTAHTRVSSLLQNAMLFGGVTLSWNIGALYTRKSDLRKLDVLQAQNEAQRATFLFHNRLQNEEVSGAVASLRKQLAHDDEIVRLREEIRRLGDSRVQLGTESVNDLVRDINAVSMARAQKAQHEIELLKEIYRQRYLNNE